MPTMDEFGDWTERLWRQPFPAKVTGKTNTNGVWYYAWTEQSLAASTGAYEDALGARTGDATDAWAREINNREVATNTIVMMRFRGMAASGGGPTFEFMAPDDSVTNTTTNTTYTNTTVTYSNTTVNYNTNSVVNVTNTSTYNFQAGSTIIFGGPTINMTANTSVTLSSTTVLTVTGGAKVVMETPLEVCGYMFWCYQTEDEWTTDQNNWDGPSFAGFEAVVYRILANTDPVNLTGMVPEADGQVVCLTNVGTFNITLKSESASSTAANRFLLPGSADLVLSTYDSVICWYDPVDTRWKVIGASGATGAITPLASGGTGSSLSDPNDDRILFWDDSAGEVTWLTVGSNLSITGTTLNASGTVGGSGVVNYYPYWDTSSTLTTGTIKISGSINESDAAFLAGSDTFIGAIGGDGKTVYLYADSNSAYLVLDSDGFTLKSMSAPYPGTLSMVLNGTDEECLLIGSPSSQTRFSTYDAGAIRTGASGAIGPGAEAFGGIIYNTGSGSMGTVTSITPGSGLTGSSNPITNTGTLSLTFKGPYKWGVD